MNYRDSFFVSYGKYRRLAAWSAFWAALALVEAIVLAALWVGR